MHDVSGEAWLRPLQLEKRLGRGLKKLLEAGDAKSFDEFDQETIGSVSPDSLLDVRLNPATAKVHGQGRG